MEPFAEIVLRTRLSISARILLGLYVGLSRCSLKRNVSISTKTSVTDSYSTIPGKTRPLSDPANLKIGLGSMWMHLIFHHRSCVRGYQCPLTWMRSVQPQKTFTKFILYFCNGKIVLGASWHALQNALDMQKCFPYLTQKQLEKAKLTIQIHVQSPTIPSVMKFTSYQT